MPRILVPFSVRKRALIEAAKSSADTKRRREPRRKGPQEAKHDGAKEGSDQERGHVGGHAAGGCGLRVAGPVQVQHREGEHGTGGAALHWPKSMQERGVPVVLRR